MEYSKRVIIIGSGIAGLAAAIRLASTGYDVSIFEKNSYVGGKLAHFSINDFQFDAGPSLFTQPEYIEELFLFANEPIQEYFQYSARPVSFKYFYEDGTIVNAYTNREQLLSEFEEKLGEKKTVVNKYLDEAAHIYNNIGTFFLGNSLHKLSRLFKKDMLKAIFSFRWKYIFKTMHQANSISFTNPKTIQLFNRYATYNGSNPYKAPAMLTMIPHLELTRGTYYPKGGMVSIINALYKLALKKNVKFYFSSNVQQIINEKKRATGIKVNDMVYNADIIISNSDVYFTYKNLLNNDAAAAKLLQQERSSSAFIFYWGMNTTFPQLDLHNIFFSNDYDAEFNSLFQTKTMYADPTVYINITSKCEPGIQAPNGKENWFVMVNAPADVGQDWNSLAIKYKKNIIDKIERMLNTNISRHIEAETMLHPALIEERTGSYTGSLYGTSSNSRMAAFLRHANFSNSVKGLYFAGGSVHPGGGIPLCMQSAKIVTELIQKDFKKQ